MNLLGLAFFLSFWVLSYLRLNSHLINTMQCYRNFLRSSAALHKLFFYIHVFSQVTLPVYLNFTRADLIFTVDFEIATKEDPRSFYERGVAVLCTE